MDFDLENLKITVQDLFYRKQHFLISGFFAFVFIITVSCFFVYKNYTYKIKSSNELINYIYGKDEDFIESNHKNGYALIQGLIVNKKDPKKEFFDKLEQKDDYLFKDLFLFAKRLYFNERGDKDPFYEAQSSPWSSLFMACNVFCGSYDEFFNIKNKENYLIQFLIGKCAKCSK